MSSLSSEEAVLPRRIADAIPIALQLDVGRLAERSVLELIRKLTHTPSAEAMDKGNSMGSPQHHPAILHNEMWETG